MRRNGLLMKFKKNEDEKSKPYLLSFFHNISFIAKNTRGVFILEILFFTISGLLPPLNVASISLIISGAENLLGGAAFSQTSLLTGLVLFGISLFTQRMILLGQMPLSSVFQYRIKNQIDRMVVEKTVSTPPGYPGRENLWVAAFWLIVTRKTLDFRLLLEFKRMPYFFRR